jgi:hypothetical protein
MQPVFQHIVTVFQHMATETVSADVYIFFVLCFQKMIKKNFKNFILQIYNKKKSGTVTLFQLLLQLTAAVSASHVYS